jgi:hypothetical protein
MVGSIASSTGVHDEGSPRRFTCCNWIDPATPAKSVPYLKKGVESWQVAFEAAGFRNAVIAKEAPSATEDPDWSPEDAVTR